MSLNYPVRRIPEGIPENAITQRIIKCAIEVQLEGLMYKRQLEIPVIYKGRQLGEYRLDLLVEDMVVVEVKSVERFDPVFEAQILTYLRLTEKRVGLLINFNTRLVKDGIKRFIL